MQRTDLQRGDILLALISKGTANTELRSVEQFNRLLSQFDKGQHYAAGSPRRCSNLCDDQKGINGDK